MNIKHTGSTVNFNNHSKKYGNLLNQIFTAVLCTTVLAACGSGGGSGGENNNAEHTAATYSSISSSSDVNSSSSSSAASSSSTATISTTTTDALVAAPDFDFASQSTVQLNVRFENHGGNRYQLSLYGNYQESNTGYLPHYNSQITSGALTDGVYTSQLQIPSTQTRVLAELWSYDGSAPIQAVLSVQDGILNWAI